MEGNWTAIRESEDGKSILVGTGKDIANDEADLSISQHSLNVDYLRHNLFHLHQTSYAGLEIFSSSLIFFASHYWFRLRVYFIQPDMNQYRDIFITPFSLDLWMATVVVLIIIVATVRAFGFILNSFAVSENEDEKELMSSVMVWGVAIVAQQGQPTFQFILRFPDF